MKNQDQGKTNSSGHHMCRKCGWPFLNPHPSAKNRRAHKRICGTIEGYKLGNSELDNENPDGDEHKTPTPSKTKTFPIAIADIATEFEVSDAVKGPLKLLQKISEENASVGNLCMTNSSVDSSQKPIMVHLTSEHDLASSVPNTGREEITVGPSAATSFMASTALDSLAMDFEGVKTCAVLDPDANYIYNQEVNPAEKDPEHESSCPEAVPEAYGAVLVAEKKVGGEASEYESADEAGLETHSDSSSIGVDSMKESNSITEATTFLDSGNAQIDRSTKIAESYDKRTDEEEYNTCFHSLKVPEDLFLIEDSATLLEDSKDHKPPIKFCISTDLDACQATVGSQPAIQYTTEQGENTASPKDEYVLLLEYTEGVYHNKPMVQGLPVEGSSRRSETKEDEVSNENGQMKGGEEEGSGAAGMSSETALISPESHDETGMGLELETTTKHFPVEQTMNLLEDGDIAQTGAGIVDSCWKKVKGGGGVEEDRKLSEPVVIVITRESHDETDAGIDLDTNNEGTDLETNNVQIPTERFSNYVTLSNVLKNPPHPEDLMDTQDGFEDVGRLDDKKVGRDSVSPIDTAVVLDVGSISNNDADLILTQSSAVEESCTKELAHGTSDVSDESMQTGGGDNGGVHIRAVSVNGVSADSSSQTDSLEANWGSISDIEAGKEVASLKPEGGADCQPFDKSDVFEPPSFMTLVEPEEVGGTQTKAASETQTSQNPKHKEGSPLLQAGWFPSIVHGANHSPGRKRNEEIISKVSNWSSGANKQRHIALKSLLGEANDDSKEKPPSSKDDAPISVSKNGNPHTEENAILGSKQQSLGGAGKEWNSPARYPTNIKRDKGKARNRWTPFSCCSSVHST